MSPVRIRSVLPARALAGALAVSTAATLLAMSPTASAATAAPAPHPLAFTTSGNFLKLWTAEWMGKHGAYTEADAVALAERVDYIAAMKGRFTPSTLAAMHAANPDLQVGVYRNATFGSGTKFAEALYAHDASGKRIHALDWPTTYLMETGSPGWAAEITRSCNELVAKSGYDNCYLDVLGSGPLTSTYLSSKPVNSLGAQWTPNEWIADSVALATGVRAAMDKPVYGNGIGHGGRYFSTTMNSSPLVDATDQVAAEGFVRDAKSGIAAYRPESTWKKDVDMLVDAEAKGKGLMTITKLWTNATPAQQDSWHEYALGTFLLGSGGLSKFFFLRDRGTEASQMDHPFNLINPGTPLGAYSFTGGVYRRDFTNALVLVNPTKKAATVPLTRSYVTLTGATITGSLTLAPNTAKVLRF